MNLLIAMTNNQYSLFCQWSAIKTSYSHTVSSFYQTDSMRCYITANQCHPLPKPSLAVVMRKVTFSSLSSVLLVSHYQMAVSPIMTNTRYRPISVEYLLFCLHKFTSGAIRILCTLIKNTFTFPAVTKLVWRTGWSWYTQYLGLDWVKLCLHTHTHTHTHRERSTCWQNQQIMNA